MIPSFSNCSPVFTVNAPPGTDYWRKPPNTDIRNAPIIWSREHYLPLKAFISGRLTFRAEYTSQLDQAGLILHILPPLHIMVPPKFIKAGVEIRDGTVIWNTASCEWYADWAPGPPVEFSDGRHNDAKSKDRSTEEEVGQDKDTRGGERPSSDWTTILLERATDEAGTSLNIYRIDTLPNGKETRRILREIMWVYGNPEQEWTARVGAYAARPMQNARGNLSVEFKDLVVHWAPLFPKHHHHDHEKGRECRCGREHDFKYTEIEAEAAIKTAVVEQDGAEPTSEK